MGAPRKADRPRLTILAMIVFLAAIGVITIGAVLFVHIDSAHIPLLTAVVGSIFAATIPALVGAFKAEQAAGAAKDVRDDLTNGALTNRIRLAVREELEAHDRAQDSEGGQAPAE